MHNMQCTALMQFDCRRKNKTCKADARGMVFVNTLEMCTHPFMHSPQAGHIGHSYINMADLSFWEGNFPIRRPKKSGMARTGGVWGTVCPYA